VMQVS